MSGLPRKCKRTIRKDEKGLMIKWCGRILRPAEPSRFQVGDKVTVTCEDYYSNTGFTVFIERHIEYWGANWRIEK